ncbi:MAG TPA: PUA domain-containing protein [Methanomicrobiales archaeon]|nr:PUA domain-containing protein [Methanomicrobiales archaeon]
MLKRVRTIADFQFGKGAGIGLFPDEVEFQVSTTGRVRQILLSGRRLATLRARDGRFTLSIEGATRLKESLPPPAYRVVIQDDVAEFILRGKNAFARHVLDADPGIRAGDEVMVVNTKGELLGTGAAALSGREMLAFNYGVAVNVRQGRESGCFQEE